MKLFPSEEDRIPRVTRYHVPRSFEFGSGMTEVTVTENDEHIENRLERYFPVYRAIAIGKRALSGIVEKVTS